MRANERPKARSARVAAACFLLSAVEVSAVQLSASRADEAAPTSVAAYGHQHTTCAAWTDGCTICRRASEGAAHCSTPGIACTPRGLTCEDHAFDTAAPAAR